MSKGDMQIWEWKIKIYKETGLGLSKWQIAMLRSEGIDPMQDTYVYEPPILFYYERDYFIGKTEELGYPKVYYVVHYKGWIK